MLQISPPDYKFCPFCSEELHLRLAEGHEQKYCTKCGWVYYPHVASSSCAVVVKDNQVLLVQRAREPHKGKWMFPAGFVNFGEHPYETAMREVEEETGYQAITAEFIDVLQVTDDNRPGTEGHFAFFYKVQIDTENRKEISDTEENLDIKWHALTQLPEIAWENHRKLLQELVDEQ